MIPDSVQILPLQKFFHHDETQWGGTFLVVGRRKSHRERMEKEWLWIPWQKRGQSQEKKEANLCLELTVNLCGFITVSVFWLTNP